MLVSCRALCDALNNASNVSRSAAVAECDTGALVAGRLSPFFLSPSANVTRCRFPNMTSASAVPHLLPRSCRTLVEPLRFCSCGGATSPTMTTTAALGKSRFKYVAEILPFVRGVCSHANAVPRAAVQQPPACAAALPAPRPSEQVCLLVVETYGSLRCGEVHSQPFG